MTYAPKTSDDGRDIIPQIICDGCGLIQHSDRASCVPPGWDFSGDDHDGHRRHFCPECAGKTEEDSVAEEDADLADNINHPPHYSAGGIEAIDVIEAWDLSFCLGNVVKYLARAGRKDPATKREDLEKAAWYLAREIRKVVREIKRRKP